MKILVTGGAGFIGSHVVEACLAHGHQVVVVDNLSTGKREQVPAGVTFHQLDIGDPEFLRVVDREHPDCLSHQAAQVSVAASMRDPFHDARTNIMGSLNVLEAARTFGVKKVIFASSGGTMYGEVPQGAAREEERAEPISPYGVSKATAETYLFWYATQFGLTATSLRYGNVYGPRQDPHGEAGVVAIFSKAICERRSPTINGDGEYIRDYVHGQDVARANLLAIEQPVVGAYNVGTGVGISVNELFQTLDEVAGGGSKA